MMFDALTGRLKMKLYSMGFDLRSRSENKYYDSTSIFYLSYSSEQAQRPLCRNAGNICKSFPL